MVNQTTEGIGSPPQDKTTMKKMEWVLIESRELLAPSKFFILEQSSGHPAHITLLLRKKEIAANLVLRRKGTRTKGGKDFSE